MIGSQGGPPADPISDSPPSDRDRTTVRRALVAGLLVWILSGAALGGGLASAGPRAAAAGLLLGLSAGAVVASAWLLVALGLDVYADHRPSRRRLTWTVGVTVFAVLSPALRLALGG